MARETVEGKARRYLVEGRLVIRAASSRHVWARVKGDSGELYSVTADPGGWTCSCPAYVERCCHVRALQLVALRPLGSDGTGPNGVES